MESLLLSLLFLVTSFSAHAFDLNCPAEATLIGLNSTDTFFKGDTSPICYDFQEEVCKSFITSVESVADAETYTDSYDIFTIAGCRLKDNIVKSATIKTLSNGRPTSLEVQCCQLKSAFTVDKQFVKDSNASRNTKVDCGDSAAVQHIKLEYPGKGASTKVTLSCATLKDLRPAPVATEPPKATTSKPPKTTTSKPLKKTTSKPLKTTTSEPPKTSAEPPKTTSK